ncbi:hypothetical protein CKAN_01454600 [Cinnamomum micranthum f. kanehirae]|uniref:Rx N-terminal domain-containing protein n=1 Tax=Cinnamomum micranthum f. kanehirae TaxID=337451 RepID=A0A3S3ML44_9MAGN|nr:hypothetical protein CKAN_01454600 [Cinnamomum micranthum f. kanehirae]
MADAVVSVLVEKLLRLLLEEGQQLLDLDDQFDKMKDELRYVKNLPQGCRNNEEKGWKGDSQVDNTRLERVGV